MKFTLFLLLTVLVVVSTTSIGISHKGIKAHPPHPIKGIPPYPHKGIDSGSGKISDESNTKEESSESSDESQLESKGDDSSDENILPNGGCHSKGCKGKGNGGKGVGDKGGSKGDGSKGDGGKGYGGKGTGGKGDKGKGSKGKGGKGNGGKGDGNKGDGGKGDGGKGDGGKGDGGKGDGGKGDGGKGYGGKGTGGKGDGGKGNGGKGDGNKGDGGKGDGGKGDGGKGDGGKGYGGKGTGSKGDGGKGNGGKGDGNKGDGGKGDGGKGDGGKGDGGKGDGGKGKGGKGTGGKGDGGKGTGGKGDGNKGDGGKGGKGDGGKGTGSKGGKGDHGKGGKGDGYKGCHGKGGNGCNGSGGQSSYENNSESNSKKSSESSDSSDSSDCRQSSEELVAPKEDKQIYDTVAIVKSFNYPCESHEVITSDGFKIEIHRIPGSKHKGGKAVVLFGGFWSSSRLWVISGKEYSLALYLANQGYDVWLGNNRGNKYGQKHILFDIRHPSYWDFSFDKIGWYDMPAIIDYIIEQRKCEKISVIAFGYGATAFFAMVSEKPEYADKISSMHALAPAVYMQNTQSILLRGFVKDDQESIFNSVGRYEIIPNKALLHKAGRLRCLHNSEDKSYCNYLQPLFCGSNIVGIKNPYYPQLLRSPISQSSVKFLMHILQQVQGGCFRKFDFGFAANQLIYGSEIPPEYNLSNAKMPVAVYFSNYDMLASPKDVLSLWKELPNKIEKYCIEDPEFSHLHFVISEKAKKAFYGPLKKNLEKYA